MLSSLCDASTRRGHPLELRCEVSFPGVWGVLAFVGNFIPYVGGVIALVLPVLLALLELEPPWRPL